MSDPGFWLLQTLNALQFSLLLFLLSVGLTVIFGLLHFVNLAHGSLYMMGAFIGVSVAAYTGSYWFALLTAPVAVMAIGALLYFTLIRNQRRASPMNQVLITFGLVFVFLDLARLFWGDIGLSLSVPPSLSGTVRILIVDYPAYRLFTIVLGLIVLGVLAYGLEGTQVGAMVRASVENETMAAALGINAEALFFIIFCIGCALAGLAGVVAAPVFSASTGMGVAMLVPTLVVVVIGGLGSLKGAVAGAFCVGFVETFGAAIIPDFASVLVYVLLAAILILRPAGLIPARG